MPPASFPTANGLKAPRRLVRAFVRRITQGLFPSEQREAPDAGIVLITDETERSSPRSETKEQNR